MRKQHVTESSLIVTWYTREFGKLKTIAKGARRPKGPFQGKIDLFYVDELLFMPSKSSDLHLLHDCFLEQPHKALRERMESFAAASYVCELLELATEREDPNPELFDLLLATLNALESNARPEPMILWFELHLLAAIGWKPKWEGHSGVTRVLNSLLSSRIEAVTRIRLTHNQIAEARDVIWRFLDAQIERAPRSRKLLIDGSRTK